MNWYAITGVVNGEYYRHVFQAGSMGHAERLFTDFVFRAIADEYYHDDPENWESMEAAINAVYEDYAPPWIVSAVRAECQPAFIFGV